jgi:DNA-binding beta-propeller fold protein YncE
MIFKRTHIFTYKLLLVLFILFTSCMKDDQWVKEHLQQGNLSLSQGGVFIVNEGNFMYGNSTLTHYDTLKKEVQNDLFYHVNGLPLGDVAESMTIWGSKGYVVINNSGKIYVLDINNGKYTEKITGLISPRFIHFVNSEKAYVTDLYAGKITIVNPATCQITGVITCPSHPSTEEMVQFENLLFVTCWSGDKTVLVLDVDRNRIIAEISTGEQPCGIVLDRFNKIWVLCQSRPGSISTNSALLQRIDPLTLLIERSFSFPLDAKPVKLTLDAKGDNLFYLLGNDIRKMAVTSDRLPDKAFISLKSKLLYGLGIDPVNGNIYVSDALDYQQPGIITRFTESGNPIDTFKAGIIPGRFCFK